MKVYFRDRLGISPSPIAAQLVHSRGQGHFTASQLRCECVFRLMVSKSAQKEGEGPGQKGVWVRKSDTSTFSAFCRDHTGRSLRESCSQVGSSFRFDCLLCLERQCTPFACPPIGTQTQNVTRSSRPGVITFVFRCWASASTCERAQVDAGVSSRTQPQHTHV